MNHSIPAEPSLKPSSRPAPLILAGGVAIGWLSTLLILTVCTANPVTVNRQQILESDVVVKGKITGEKTLAAIPGGDWPVPDDAPLQVMNLKETGAKIGETYTIPLNRILPADGSSTPTFIVTFSHLPNGKPLIYPVGEETDQQLQAIRQAAAPR